MFLNYLKMAVRFMLKQTAFSFINIFGLTIGLTCSLLILLYIQNELSYDKFHDDAFRTYRITFHGLLQRRTFESTLTGSAVGGALVNEIPEVEAALRMANWPTFPMRFQNTAFTEKYMLLADSNFFDFFSFKLVQGNPKDVLTGKGKLVVTESAAKKYLGYKGDGDNTPIGKKFVLAQGYEAVVSGIAADPPLNSHFHYSYILSLRSWDELDSSNWYSGKVLTYIKVKEDADIGGVNEAANRLLKENLSKDLELTRQMSFEEFTRMGNRLRFGMQPLTSIHLESHLSDEIEVNGDIQNIYLFSSIAFFILMLACINFMNLSTARSASRSKEVGVRKTVGAHFSLIVRQFLIESYFYIIVAILLSMVLIFILLGPLNYFTEKQMSMKVFGEPVMIFSIITFTILVGLLAGSYPAFYLSRFSPIEVLKGKLRRRLRRYGVRNVLVVFQFFISASLIIATIVVYQQLNYVQEANLGYEKRNVINLLHTKNLGRNGEAFKEGLKNVPGVISASYCNRLPPNMDWQATFSIVGSKEDHLLTVYEMDYDHLETMGYTMKEGRFFSRKVPSDSFAVILNETAIKKMRLPGALDKSLTTSYDVVKNLERKVIGVMNDFNFRSLHEPIQPMAVILGYSPNWEMAIRLDGKNQEVTLELIRDLWRKHAPGAAFEYTFMEKNFAAMQKTEANQGSLFLLFTLLAITIACLGLFGLATFATEQRTKEIGIRKVMGASVFNIGMMLNLEFIRLVLLANLFAWPFSWWVMTVWLQQFAYHIGIQWWFFVLSAAITIAIAFLSVSYQVLKVSFNNPVESLRYD